MSSTWERIRKVSLWAATTTIAAAAGAGWVASDQLRVDPLVSEVARLQQRIQELAVVDARAENLDTQVADLGERLREARAANSAQEVRAVSTIEGLRGQLAQIEATAVDLRGQVRDATTLRNTADAQVSELRDRLRSCESELNALRRDRNDLEKAVSSLTAQVSAEKAANAGVQRLLAEIASQRDAAVGQRSAAEQQITLLAASAGTRAPVLQACLELAHPKDHVWASFGELHGGEMRNAQFSLEGAEPRRAPRRGDRAITTSFVNTFDTAPQAEIALAGNILEWFLPERVGAVAPGQWVEITDIDTVPGGYHYVRFKLIKTP